MSNKKNGGGGWVVLLIILIPVIGAVITEGMHYDNSIGVSFNFEDRTIQLVNSSLASQGVSLIQREYNPQHIQSSLTISWTDGNNVTLTNNSQLRTFLSWVSFHNVSTVYYETRMPYGMVGQDADGIIYGYADIVDFWFPVNGSVLVLMVISRDFFVLYG